MKIEYPSLEEVEVCLQKGFDWETRRELVGEVVIQIIEANPGKTYRNGQLVSAALKAYDIKTDRQSPLYKPLSATVTAIGKMDGYKEYVHAGKEIRCGNHKDGSPRYARERLWRTGSLEENDRDDVGNGKSEWQDPALKTHIQVPIAEYEDLCQRAMHSVIAEGLDKCDIVRQPKPGYGPVTCHHCGGTGRVYKRKEQ